MNQEELTWLPLTALSDAIHRRQVTSVQATTASLDRIEHLDRRLNSFITVTSDAALREATEADREIASGQSRGPLHGVPIAVKDLCDTRGTLTTAGSGVFSDRVPDDDAEVVRRLRRGGAVSLGKLNMHEFAYGGTSHVTHYGPPRNPWDPDRITGGSSGGSAAAVAAGLCFGAIGTDTGGSIREPASLCGIVGIKATHGLVSTRGIVPLSWSLDHAGPMTRTVTDAAVMLDVLAGYDAGDAVSVERPSEHYALAAGQDVRHVRVGIPREPFFLDLDSEVADIMRDAIALIGSAVASVSDVALPFTNAEELRAISGRVLQAEAYAYHHELLVSHGDRYDPDTRGRAERGAAITVPEYIEASRALVLLRRQVLRTFADVDVLVTPTVPRAAPRFDELEDAGIGMALLRNTSPFNAYGLPTITVPVGTTASGLPVGVQITAAPFAEAAMISLAARVEQLVDPLCRANGDAPLLQRSLERIAGGLG